MTIFRLRQGYGGQASFSLAAFTSKFAKRIAEILTNFSLGGKFFVLSNSENRKAPHGEAVLSFSTRGLNSQTLHRDMALG